MKTLMLAAATAVGLGMLAPAQSQAAEVQVSVQLGIPVVIGYPYVAQRPTVVYQPRVVYRLAPYFHHHPRYRYVDVHYRGRDTWADHRSGYNRSMAR